METGQEIIANYIQSLSPRGLLIVYEDRSYDAQSEAKGFGLKTRPEMPSEIQRN